MWEFKATMICSHTQTVGIKIHGLNFVEMFQFPNATHNFNHNLSLTLIIP